MLEEVEHENGQENILLAKIDEKGNASFSR